MRLHWLAIHEHAFTDDLDEHCSPTAFPDKALSPFDRQRQVHLRTRRIAPQDLGKKWSVHGRRQRLRTGCAGRWRAR